MVLVDFGLEYWVVVVFCYVFEYMLGEIGEIFGLFWGMVNSRLWCGFDWLWLVIEVVEEGL